MAARAKGVVINQSKPDHHYPASLERFLAAVGHETDKKKVLALILPGALTISQTEVGMLLLTNDASTSLNVVAKQGLRDEIITQFTGGEFGRLLLMGQRLWIKPQPLQLTPEQALLGRHKLKYLFGLPLRYGGQTLGAIVVGSWKSVLGQTQQERLEMLAQVVALFLDDIRLRTKSTSDDPSATEPKSDQAPVGANPDSTSHSPLDPDASTPADDVEQLLAALMSAEEEVANQNYDLGLLNTFSNEVGRTLQLDSILDVAIRQSQTALKAEAGWCYLLQDDVLTLRKHQGLSDEYAAKMQHLSPGNGTEGMAFVRNETILRDGLLFHSGQTRRWVQQEGLRTIAAVPLTKGETTFGVLAVGNRHDRDWTGRDKRMLISIGQQLSQAITNSQTFDEAKQKAQTFEADYTSLQQANTQLMKRATTLEKQIQGLRQVEQQIWSILAASRKASNKSDPDGEQLMTTLKKVLAALSQASTH